MPNKNEIIRDLKKQKEVVLEKLSQEMCDQRHEFKKNLVLVYSHEINELIEIFKEPLKKYGTLINKLIKDPNLNYYVYTRDLGGFLNSSEDFISDVMRNSTYTKGSYYNYTNKLADNYEATEKEWDNLINIVKSMTSKEAMKFLEENNIPLIYSVKKETKNALVICNINVSKLNIGKISPKDLEDSKDIIG